MMKGTQTIEQGAAAVTFTETLAREFPDAVPTNQFVSATQNALAQHGVLRGGALAAAFADGNLDGLRAQLQHLFGDQRVVQDDIRLGEKTRPAHGDQVGCTGTGANQIDLADRLDGSGRRWQVGWIGWIGWG